MKQGEEYFLVLCLTAPVEKQIEVLHLHAEGPDTVLPLPKFKLESPCQVGS